MKQNRKILKKYKSSKKAQTALEYALVVGAISLVIMAAWNTVGANVQELVRNTLGQRIEDNLQRGNATVTDN